MSSQTTEPQGEPRLDAAILASVPLGLYVLDRDWRFLYLNPQAERFFWQLSGRTRDQLYEEAKHMNIEGRSSMNKAQLQRAVDAKK